jgi:hypothetical protein
VSVLSDARRTGRPLRRFLFLPFAALLLLFGLWTVFWFVAREEVVEGIAAFRAQEAMAGRAHECDEERVGGFPFRFEWHCEDFVSRIQGSAGPLALHLPRVTVVAQAYRPNHVIVEAEGPLDVAPAGAAPTMLDWSSARASLRTGEGRVERASLVLEAPTLDAPVSGGDVASVRAAGIEFHLRAKPDAAAADYDLAAAVRALEAAPGEVPWDGALEAGLFALPQQADDLRSFLRAWAEGNGQLGITRLVLTNGEAVLRGTGSVTLDAQGRPEGEIDLAVAGLERAGESVSGTAALISMAAGFLGTPIEVEGKSGKGVKLTLENGAMRLGAVPLGQLPPLY